MKNILIIIGLSLALNACQSSKKEAINELGYIVECDYEHSKICCSEVQFDRKLVIVVNTNRHIHHLEPAEFTIYFANRDGIKKLEVDSASWFKLSPGNKVIYTLDTNNVEHLYKIK